MQAFLLYCLNVRRWVLNWDQLRKWHKEKEPVMNPGNIIRSILADRSAVFNDWTKAVGNVCHPK